MMYEIRVRVVYSEGTVPDDMEYQLRDNVQRCIECAELLNDSNLEAVVDEWSVEVKEKAE